MSEYLTPGNIALALVLLRYAYDVLKFIAPKTASAWDDNAVLAAEKAGKWAVEMAPSFWAIVEMAAKNPQLPVGWTKATDFLCRLRIAYNDQFKNPLPIEAQKAAVTIAEGLSAADKLVKLNPLQAPVLK